MADPEQPFEQFLDQELSKIDDRGMKGVWLNEQLLKWKGHERAIEDWALDPCDESPAPVNGMTIMEAGSRVWQIEKRLDDLRARIRADIAAHEAER